MGSRIASPLVIISLEYLKKQTIFSDLSLHVLFYRRYVDDAILLVKDNENAKDILNVMKNHHPSIKFELELPDENNSLNILDTNITVSSDGLIQTKFYEKSAKKNLFIHANSAQPTQMKRAAIKSELRRINERCNPGSLAPYYIERFKKKLLSNGYKNEFIDNINFRNNDNSSIVSTDAIYLSTPFISDRFQNKMKNILKTCPFPVRISNRSENTLRTTLNRTRTCFTLCPLFKTYLFN